MIFVITLVLAVLLLPWPFNLAAISAAAAIEFSLAFFGIRWTRRRPVAIGVQSLLGQTAEVITSNGRDAQVRLDGEIWEVRAAAPLEPGDAVRVTGRDRLTLQVEPVEDPSGAARAGAVIAP